MLAYGQAPQRREISNSLPDEKGPAKAALHRQLSLMSKEIEGLEAGTVDPVIARTPDLGPVGHLARFDREQLSCHGHDNYFSSPSTPTER